MIEVGKIFADRYGIIKSIGRGGMADVYLGQDLFLDNIEVAIKVLRTNYQTDSIAIDRFQREARAMAELNHPNIVRISDIGEEAGQQYLAMEYVDGTDLKHYIREHAPLPVSIAIDIMGQILLAMQRAHEIGFIHRDLKPQNILLTNDGQVKVTDFGIAVAFLDTRLTQTNSVLGSVHYLSPEQARGNKASVQSDIYAMGIILYEMLTGEVPFDGDSPITVALKHSQEEVPDVRTKNPNVPVALARVVSRATARDLTVRYASVSEMYSDLAACLSRNLKKEQDAINLHHVSSSNNETELALNKEKRKETTSFKQFLEKIRKHPHSKGILVGLVIMGLISAGVIAFIASTPSTVQVPYVVGDSLSTAKEKLSKEHLNVGKVIKESSEDVPEGHVISSNPKAGVSRKFGTDIVLVISTGKKQIDLPDCSGYTEKTGKERLEKLGFKVKVVREYNLDISKGMVIRTEPAYADSTGKRAKAPAGSVIKLVVSDYLELPNVAGLTEKEARSRLQAAGFEVAQQSITSTENPSNLPLGSVIRVAGNENGQASQHALADKIDPKNNKVILVTAGTITVPDVRWTNIQQAKSRLEKLGITCYIQYIPGGTKDLVYEQSWVGTTNRNTVTLTVYAGGGQENSDTSNTSDASATSSTTGEQ